ncbi:MAG: c-type cytochrome [Terriglobales bacterium]
MAMVGLAAAQQTPAEKTADQVFKNIQVFKGKPANELIPTMEFIASSLGVRCSYCHVENKSLDVKPEKKRARQMVEMVYAINQSTFGGRNEVNCYTCHRGSPHPDGRLNVASLTAQAAPEQQAGEAEGRMARANLPTAQAILSKYRDAIGGADALAAVHAERVSAQQMRGGRTQAVTVVRADGKLLLTSGASKSGYDGATFWSSGRRGVTRNPESSTITQLQTDLPLYPAAGLDAAKARVFGERNVNGQQAYLVGARTASGFNLYAFDAQTGFLLQYTTNTPTFLGSLPLQVNYSDYRNVSGIKLPFVLTFATHEGHWERKITNVQVNAPVSASSFVVEK